MIIKANVFSKIYDLLVYSSIYGIKIENINKMLNFLLDNSNYYNR